MRERELELKKMRRSRNVSGCLRVSDFFGLQSCVGTY